MEQNVGLYTTAELLSLFFCRPKEVINEKFVCVTTYGRMLLLTV